LGDSFLLHLPPRLTKLVANLEFVKPEEVFARLPRRMRTLRLSCPDFSYLGIRRNHLEMLPKSLTSLALTLPKKHVSQNDLHKVLPHLDEISTHITWQ
jgi:hypothetical protein